VNRGIQRLAEEQHAKPYRSPTEKNLKLSCCLYILKNKKTYQQRGPSSLRYLCNNHKAARLSGWALGPLEDTELSGNTTL